MYRQLLLIATLLPSALCVTTLQAILVPTNAAASVLSVADGATTYSIQCTKSCAANAENNQATLVNGPSTAGLTQIMGDSGRTLIMDCRLSPDKKGDCTTKAISKDETRTGPKSILTFSDVPVVITGGLEKLGYVVVETTMEVNATVIQKNSSKGASSTAVSATVTGSQSSRITAMTATSTKASSATAKTLPSAIGLGVTTDSSTAAAAPTMKTEYLGGAIIGLAGILIAML